eukprot:3229318-Prymnesium_polylepis.1
MCRTFHKEEAGRRAGADPPTRAHKLVMRDVVKAQHDPAERDDQRLAGGSAVRAKDGVFAKRRLQRVERGRQLRRRAGGLCARLPLVLGREVVAAAAS